MTTTSFSAAKTGYVGPQGLLGTPNQHPCAFEGPEKKLEIRVRGGGLRGLGDAFWRQVVDLAQASILSTIDNRYCTAHLLSESSLFIYDDRVIMITCGQTTLVESALHILEAIDDDDLARVVYERKSEYYPHLQLSTFRDDLARLEQKIGGRHHAVGSGQNNFMQIFVSDRSRSSVSKDRTKQSLELLMHGIDRGVAACFSAQGAGSQRGVDLQNRLHHMLPGFQVDEHFFEPCGYSLNALRDAKYFTFHVTPEDAHSYVSFETNYPFSSHEELDQLIREVVGLFAPSRLDILHLVPEQSSWGDVALLHHSPGVDPKEHEVVYADLQSLNDGYQLRSALFQRSQSETSR